MSRISVLFTTEVRQPAFGRKEKRPKYLGRSEIFPKIIAFNEPKYMFLCIYAVMLFVAFCFVTRVVGTSQLRRQNVTVTNLNPRASISRMSVPLRQVFNIRRIFVPIASYISTVATANNNRAINWSADR